MFLARCDLLSFYYLCRTGNSEIAADVRLQGVVICFHFTTFAVLETAKHSSEILADCCDLLSFYYLCRTGNSTHFLRVRLRTLWFAFILLPLPYWKQPTPFAFARSSRCDLLSFYYLCRTGNSFQYECAYCCQLWFAFILLPLPYWKQPILIGPTIKCCCDLLSFYYLCRTGNSCNV